MKSRAALLLSLLTAACLIPAAHADVAFVSPLDRMSSTAYSAAPWLLIAALVGFTLLLLWKLRKKK